MQFNSITFVIFMCILLPILAITRNKKIRHTELLVASYIFYGFGDYRFCFLMLLLTIIAYICSAGIIKNKDKDGSIKVKLYLRLGVIFPLIILGFFKYFNFFRDSFMSVFGLESDYVIRILLPVGISFYTFQSISLVVDAHRGDLWKDTEETKELSFMDVALYIAFFPQLVAGPIVKSKDFLPQLKEDRNVTFLGLEEGIKLFILGLFKKIVIADRISIFVEEIYDNPQLFSWSTILLGVLAYSVQIYCDFSGYSDMAIGTAKCIGYDLKKNFDLPYISKSVTEFWRRWHISLSTWLREYIYIPLGGNRKGRIRTYINLYITMLVSGMWHGANWTFVIWGALYGAIICFEKAVLKINVRNGEAKIIVSKFKSIILIIKTFILVSALWIVFRSQSVEEAVLVYKCLFTLNHGISHMYVWAFIGIAFIYIEALVNKLLANKERVIRLDTIGGLTFILVALGITLGFAYISTNPFIYFRF